MEQNAPNDADLVAETLAGNREAFGKLYDRHGRIVRAVVSGVSGDWSAMDDMVQECFLRGYRNLARLRDPLRFGPWVMGIARQVARERRRALRRDRHEFQNQQIAKLGLPATVEAEAEDREQLELVLRKLAMLPEKERLAIHAFFLEQRNARQTAELLGYSRSGFYLLVQKGIARLAELMRPCEANQQKGSVD